MTPLKCDKGIERDYTGFAGTRHVIQFFETSQTMPVELVSNHKEIGVSLFADVFVWRRGSHVYTKDLHVEKLIFRGTISIERICNNWQQNSITILATNPPSYSLRASFWQYTTRKSLNSSNHPKLRKNTKIKTQLSVWTPSDVCHISHVNIYEWWVITQVGVKVGGRQLMVCSRGALVMVGRVGFHSYIIWSTTLMGSFSCMHVCW